MIDSLPGPVREKLYEAFDCKITMIPIMLVSAAGAVVAIAGGYWAIYQLVTLIGAR